MLIIGSYALKYHFPDCDRVIKDIDFIMPVTKQYLSNNCPKSFGQDNPLKAEYFVVPDDIYYAIEKVNTIKLYLDVNLLYTLKLSHMAWEGWNGKWEKHLADIIFLQEAGAKCNEDIFEMLYKFWEVKFGNKSNIKLNVSKETMFKNTINRKFSHDALHVFFAIWDSPAYMLAKDDGDTQTLSKDKFDRLTRYSQLYCALEEMFVIAAERQISLSESYKKLITTMTKGWFNRFMLDNAFILVPSDCLDSEKREYKKKRKIYNRLITMSDDLSENKVVNISNYYK